MRSILEILTNSNEVPLPSFPPGLRMLFGRAWRITLPPVPGRNTMAHSDVVRFLGTDTESGRPGNFREYLEGVGTVNDFAALIARHIFHAMPDSTHIHLHFQLSVMLRMLVERNDHSGPLHMALLDHGIVRWITKILCHYAVSVAEETMELVAMCFTLLQRAFDAFPSYPAVTEALESSTLITLISRCAQRQGTHWNHYLRRLFATVLPRSMVSYQVVRELSRCRIDEQRLLPVLEFQDAELTATWERFNTLATATISILQAYDSGVYPAIRACDNMKCGRLCGQNEIKCCSSCHQTNYCSAKCQSIDWRVDGHRAICQRLRPLRLAEYTLPSVRDNSFLRALIHHLHEVRIVALCIEKVHFMYLHPGVPFYVLCDCTRGDTIIVVRSCAEPPPDPAGSDASAAQWEDQVACMMRSGGRMGIIVVLVAVGRRKVRRMAALRTDTSALNDALAQIVAGLPSGLNRATVEFLVRTQIDETLQKRHDRGED
ncbi:hypothetical protein C8R45DRAFT_1157101 [Mycena sanguinolenta]|nr:hypothetical protein C8R45DRAFT_1157101 [Mycena sanguinolenta]